MKKIFCLILAVLLMAGQVYAYEPGYRQGTDYAGIDSGGEKIGQNGQDYAFGRNRTFRFVRVLSQDYDRASGTGANNAQLITISGNLLYVWLTGTSGSDGVTVVPSYQSNDNRIAGVIPHTITISSTDHSDFLYVSDDVGKDNWAWLQVYGPCYVRIGAGVTAGDLINTGSPATGTGATNVTGEAYPWIWSQVSASNTGQRTGANGSSGFFMDSDTSGGTGSTVRAFLKCQ